MNTLAGATVGGCVVGGCLLWLLTFVIYTAAIGSLIYFTWGLYEAPLLIKIGISFLIYLIVGSVLGKLMR